MIGDPWRYGLKLDELRHYKFSCHDIDQADIADSQKAPDNKPGGKGEFV